MNLKPVINDKCTCKNVRNFFEKEFPRLVLIAGYSMLEVQSPRFSITPVNNTSVNNQEKKEMDHFEAQEIVKKTITAINNCHTPSNKILLNVYIKELHNVDVQVLLGYERSQYYRLKKRACLNFADAFMGVTDLHVYE